MLLRTEFLRVDLGGASREDYREMEMDVHDLAERTSQLGLAGVQTQYEQPTVVLDGQRVTTEEALLALKEKRLEAERVLSRVLIERGPNKKKG